MMKLFKKRSKTLVVAEDGVGIWGIVVNGNGTCAENCFSLDTPLKTILEFGKKQKVKEVLFLRISDVQEIDVKLGPDLDAEERHSAIEYAAAGNMGDTSGRQRVSYMDGMLHDFRSGILVSYFDLEDIANLAKIVKEEKLKFLGVTNFKQLFMSEHFFNIEHHDECFLFLLGSHGFMAIPDRNKLIVRNLPLGVPRSGDDAEWRERMQRRLIVLKYKRVTLYSPSSSPELCAAIKDMTEANSVTCHDWKTGLIDGSEFFIKHGIELIKPALLPPKPKDPKAPGTVIGLTLIGMVVFAMGFLLIQNYTVYRKLDERYHYYKKIEKQVKDAEAEIKELDEELSSEQQIHQMLSKKERLSRRFLLIFNLLGRYPLKYTRINKIEESTNGILIDGETAWHPDLSRFFIHFEKELRRYNLALFSDGLTKEKNGQIIFHSRISDRRQ